MVLNLSSQWYIDSNVYYSNDVDLALTNGSHYVYLANYNSPTLCDSVNQVIIVACSTTSLNPTNCFASSNLQVYADTANLGNYFA